MTIGKDYHHIILFFILTKKDSAHYMCHAYSHETKIPKTFFYNLVYLFESTSKSNSYYCHVKDIWSIIGILMA